MKSLRIIQILAKIARIICLIVFICCIIGAVGCAVGLLVFGVSKDVVVQDGKTLADLLAEKNVPIVMAYSGMAVGIVACGVEAFLAKHAELFFKREIANGTPFDKKIVKDMRTVAVVNMIVNVAASLICGITLAIIAFVNGISVSFRSELFGSLGFGIILLVLSLFCDYGAEVKEQNDINIVKVENDDVNKE